MINSTNALNLCDASIENHALYFYPYVFGNSIYIIFIVMVNSIHFFLFYSNSIILNSIVGIGVDPSLH
jgi:hypothetical protein